MSRLQRLAGIGVLLIGAAISRNSSAANAPQTETIWRGVFQRDSLFVSATWVPVVGSARCDYREGDDVDSTNVGSKYLDYQVTSSSGRTVVTNSLTEDFYRCCDALSAAATPWHKGLVLAVTVDVWDCEPAGSCEETEFYFISEKHKLARSGWVGLSWDPTISSLIQGIATQSCFSYPMTLAPIVVDTVLTFEPRFPPNVKLGEVFEKRLDNDPETGMNCERNPKHQSRASIDLFPTAVARAGKRLIVNSSDPLEVVSVVVRADRSADGGLAPSIVRAGIRSGERRGFVSLGSLRALGFDLP